MRFANPEALLLILLLLTLGAITFIRERRRTLAIKEKFSARNLEKMKLRTGLDIQNFIARACFYLFLIFMVIALARPQSGQVERDEISSEHSVIFLIDLSRSMLTTDISPSRLELTKKEIIKSLELLEGVKVGLVAFAGSAAVISPMTTDLSALEMYLDSLSTDTISSQGTEVFAALDEAKGMFERIIEKEGLKKSGEKVIVLFSDGENHQKSSVDMVSKMSKKGYRVFAVGVGTESGGYIPQFEGAREYMKTSDGQLAVSKPNYDFLKDIAKAGRGSFYSLNPLAPFSIKLQKDLEKIESVNSSKRKFIVKNEIFQFMLQNAFMFLIFSILIRRKE